MDFLSNAAETIALSFSSVGSLLLTVLNINFVVLSALFSTILSFTYSVLEILTLVGYALLCAAEDFKEFVGEISGGVFAFVILVQNIAQLIYKGLSWICGSSYDVILKFGWTLHSFSTTSLDFLKYLVFLLQAFAVLVAQSVLMILEFLPWSIASIATSVKDSAIYLLKGFVNGCNTTTASTIKTMKEFLSITTLKIYNIPRNAYIGLLIVLLLIIFQKFLKSFMFRIAILAKLGFVMALRFFTDLLYKLLQSIFRYCCYTQSFLLQRLRHLHSYSLLALQRFPRPNFSGTYEENEEVTDDEDNMATDRGSDEELEDPSPSSSSLNQLKKLLEEQKGAQTCIVCLERPKDTIFLPCRHLCACQDCCTALVYRRATCPLCRQYIRNTIRVYT